MYNQHKKSETDDLVRQEGVDFYVPIGAILIERDCCAYNIKESRDNDMEYEQQPFVCPLEIPTLETRTEIKSTRLYGSR